ncbi:MULTISPECIES: CsiV family protein [Colwellia]|uniref:Uncharacterized protein n=1 Tax=Colwellia marinimaniae TaxID=1513592 RepID=A0ABQ0MRZ6_9GAMM|nr:MULTISPECIES: CsiV family protein [Colwellia]GAW95129.1 hypothetical protein MTCD1_00728 [Colwellia marinimaniae]
MKYHFLLTSALTSLCLLSSNTALAANSTKVPAEKPARWFEIEVILFKHLAKNSDNKEQFTARDLSAKKRVAFDLLTPYLQPNIASLKQLLPNCEQPQSKLPYNITLTPYHLWPTVADKQVSNEKITDEQSVDTASEQNNTQANKENNAAVFSSANMSVIVLADASHDSAAVGLAAETAANLAERSEQGQYVHMELPVYTQYPSSSQAAFCVIPADFFQQHLSAEQLAHFSIDGFEVEKLATTINGIEQWRDDENGAIIWASDKPYLISQDSLRLKSIANRIKRSRDYKPLLHLGWRQIGANRRQAQAMQLFAGEHLELGYQQALTQQQGEQNTLQLQAILAQRQQALINSQMLMVESDSESMLVRANATTALNKTLINADTNPNIESNLDASGSTLIKLASLDELSITEQLRQQAKQQQLDSIYQQFAALDSALLNASLLNKAEASDTSVNGAKATDTEEVIKTIVAQLSADINQQQRRQLTAKDEQEKPVATPPLQPWYLDGLFKVHLEHYLYINSEFNMVETSNQPSMIAGNTDKNAKDKIISFKQSRRVITGEIHYFDHPYIGMIVQIRRFDPSKPAKQAVTQSKK